MLTGLGRANAPGSRADGLQRIIPLEAWTTGTPILYVHTLPKIKFVMKFPCACRAVHFVIHLFFFFTSSLITAQLYAIIYLKGNKIFLLAEGRQQAARKPAQ